MIIGIDGNEVNIKKRVGVNQYGFKLLHNLRKLQDEWKDKHSLVVYLREKPLPDMPEESEQFTYKVIPGGGAWILKKLTPYLIFGKDKPDIFFSPSHYAPPVSTVPRVCSIMDLGYLEFSGQFTKRVFWQLKYWSAISILVSKRVIAISNSTKKDIVRHYPFASGKVDVTLLAYDKERFNEDVGVKDVRRVKDKYSITKDYVLFLSTLKPSKNIEGLLEAWKKICRDFDETNLVIAGKKGWLYESIFEKVKDLGLEDSVIFTDFVDEEDKPALIAGARLFVLPSFWEGFGLDVLNAMACGVPVVVSDVGSLPEVAGNAGLYVDPNEPETIAENIKKVLNMGKKDYNRLVEEGLRQVKKFSWKKTARQTLKILERVGR